MNRPAFDCFALLPAQPGYSALTLLIESKSEPIGVDRNVVIAWAFEAGFMTPIPVTLEGVVRDEYAIQLPGGDVYLPGAGEAFDSPEEWLAECKDNSMAQERYEAYMAADSVDVTGKNPPSASSCMSPHPAIHAALAAARNATAARIATEQAVSTSMVMP